MACIFKYNNGKISNVVNEDGTPSELYQDALQEFNGDIQQAAEIVATSLSPDFSEEPTLNNVLNFIARQKESDKPLTAQQEQDVKNTLLSLNISNVEELQQSLQTAFYPEGDIFNPTEDSLIRSGIYSEYEVDNILTNIDLQTSIKQTVEALDNSVFSGEYTYGVTEVKKSDEINSLGKLTALNPFLLKKQELENTLEPVSDGELKYEAQDISRYSKAENMMQNKEGEIVVQPERDVEAELSLAVKADAPARVFDSLDTLLSTPTAVLNENPEHVSEILSELENDLINIGLDVIGLDTRAQDPNLKQFLTSLKSYLVSADVGFAQEYSNFFNVETQQKRTVVEEPNTRNYVQLLTNKSEQDLLEQDNLLKVKENLFMKVRRLPVAQMYAITGLSREEVDAMNQPTEELALMKHYFGTPLVFRAVQNLTAFSGNQKYLETDFVADFQAERLKQKKKDSAQWKNFYSNFEINNLGINLLNNDPITLETINTWTGEIKESIANNLRQYSLISRQLPNLSQEGEVNARDNAVNNPYSVPQIENKTYKIDENTIISLNETKDFVRVGEDVFEAVEAKDNMVMYLKLPKNEGLSNRFGTKKPETKEQLRDYQYLEQEPDKWVSQSNKASKEQRENFECK